MRHKLSENCAELHSDAKVPASMFTERGPGRLRPLLTTGAIWSIIAEMQSCPSESSTPASAPSSSRTRAASLRPAEGRTQTHQVCITCERSHAILLHAARSEGTAVGRQLQRRSLLVVAGANVGPMLHQKPDGNSGIVLSGKV